MKLNEVQRIAFLKGVDCISDSKTYLIHKIQMAEGFEPCYGTHHFECQHLDCLWRKDCLGLVRIIEVKNGD